MRQYALDYGKDGIRANGVNADRIRYGLVDNDMIAERARARGVSEADYMSGNLLKREVTAEDVAEAFVALAKARNTTRPYRYGRWRQHRRGAALKAAPTGSRGGRRAPPASTAALSVELGRTPHRAITLARLQPSLEP